MSSAQISGLLSVKDKALLAIVGGGLAMSFLEIRHLHRDAIEEHWQALIPLVFCGVATLVSMALLVVGRVSSLAMGFFLVGVLVGSYGVLMHSDGKPQRFGELLAQAQIVARAGEDENEYRGGREEATKKEAEPPVLAPLGIAGLSAIAVVVLSRRFRG